MEIGARRTGMFFFDFTLVRFVVGWPLDFFYWKSPAGPVRWRYEVGFLEREIVVRRSRRWDRGVVGVEEEKKKKEEEKEEEGGGGAVFRGEGWLGEELYRERVLPGLERAWVEGRTGYAMMDKNWDLDFDAMITAHRSLRSRTLRWEDLSSRKLAVHHPDRGWLVYSPDASLRRGEEVAEKGDVESVRRRLKDLGKENLFWKWMDVVQGVGMGMGVGVGTGMEKERSEKRKSMDRKVRDLFEREGVDFDAFWGLRGGDAEVVDTGSI